MQSDLFGFAPVEGRAVVAGFDGGKMTSGAGALLLGASFTSPRHVRDKIDWLHREIQSRRSPFTWTKQTVFSHHHEPSTLIYENWYQRCSSKESRSMNDRVEASYPLSGEPFAKGRIVTIAGETRRRSIVLVVGAPRSGMSLCAHILSAMGIDMADEIPAQPSNLRDEWERWEIGEFHDRILKLFNRAYFGPFHDLALPVAWWADPRVCQIRREIVAFLQERIGDSYFGFKDPRTVRLMPIWHHILNDLNLASKVVLCLRHPSQVARSLKARDGVDHEIGEYRWLTYMIDFFRYTNGFDICTIEYEGWLKDPLANFEKLRKFLDLRWQQNEFDLDLTLSGIIDPALNHGDSDHRKTSHSLVCSLYELASRPGLDGATRERISDAVSGFINFQQLQRPFQQAFEDIAEVASKFPELEKGAASLRAALSERDQSIEAANSRAGAAEVQLAELEQEAASLRAALSERDQSVEAASSRASVAEVQLAELKQGVEAQRAHLAEIVRDCAARAAFEGARAASASSQSAFADIESAASALQARLIEREAVLAEASHQADGRLAALQSAQKDLAMREEALQRLEQQAQEHAAGAEAMQIEIAALRSALAVAREVGKAVVAALRIEPELVQQLPPRGGWLAPIPRLFGFPTSRVNRLGACW